MENMQTKFPLEDVLSLLMVKGSSREKRQGENARIETLVSWLTFGLQTPRASRLGCEIVGLALRRMTQQRDTVHIWDLQF